MTAYGIPPMKIDSGKDIYYAGRIMQKALEEYKELGDREFLVVSKRNKVIGCTTVPGLINSYQNKRVLYLSDLLLPSVKTAHENSLSLKKISSVTGKRRSLFVIKEGVKRKRFQKYNFNDVLAEITVKLAFKMILNEPIDYPGLLKYTVKV